MHSNHLFESEEMYFTLKSETLPSTAVCVQHWINTGFLYFYQYGNKACKCGGLLRKIRILTTNIIIITNTKI